MIVCSGLEKILLVFQSKKYGRRWKRSIEPAWLHSKPFRSFRTHFMIEMTSPQLAKRLLDVVAPLIQGSTAQRRLRVQTGLMSLIVAELAH